MKKLLGLLLIAFVPIVVYGQSPVDTTSASVRPESSESVETKSDMYKQFSREDLKVLDVLGPNVLMRTEDYEKKIRSGNSNAIESEPK